MRIVLFLDLDDSVFQTAPKCPPGEPVRPAALARDGAPLSFMTDRQRTLLDLWMSAATIIPTTARNLNAFRRVEIPFDHAAILDFGGVVLRPDGNLDEDWDATVRPQVAAMTDEFRELLWMANQFIAGKRLGVVARLVTDFEMPLYLVAKHPTGDEATLGPLCEYLQPLVGERFFVHRNGNNLSVVPAFLGKEKAVRHVLATYFAEPVVTVGMGDSLTDAAFLDLCDYSLVPRLSQLAQHRTNPGERPCSAAATTPMT